MRLLFDQPVSTAGGSILRSFRQLFRSTSKSALGSFQGRNETAYPPDSPLFVDCFHRAGTDGDGNILFTHTGLSVTIGSLHHPPVAGQANRQGRWKLAGAMCLIANGC